MEDAGVMLEWKGYNSTTGEAFENLYTDQDFTDVTLACDGNDQLQAHKVILSSCSEFFSKILRQNPNPHPLIYLQGLTISDLQQLKSFMYIGRTKVSFDQIDGFLEVSKRFLNQPSEKIKPQHHQPQKNLPQNPSHDSKPNITETAEQEKKDVNIKTAKNKLPSQPHESAQTELHSCSQCSFKSESKTELSRHKLSRHANQNIACTELDCGKVFKHKSFLKAHVKKKHINLTRERFCKHCDYSTKWSSSFFRHRSKHTGNKKLCHICEYSCPTNHMLKKHMESKHSEIEYDCDQCDVKTRTRRMMKFHVNKVHNGVRYHCELCGHQATTGYNLKAHKERTHDRIEFKCTFCNFKDSLRSRISLHERRTHAESTLLKAKIASFEPKEIQPKQASEAATISLSMQNTTGIPGM